MGPWAAVVCVCVAGAPADAAITVVDDMGRQVTMEAQARRIISLAPSVAELLFAAGAGRRVVGTVRFTDFPPPARRIPRIGDATHLDMERILMLKPDLVVAWHSSLPARTLRQLNDLGLTVYITEPRALNMIASDIKRLGRLAGSAGQAEAKAARFTARLQRLRRRYSDRSPVRVFFQTWDDPLMTVNGSHFISHLLRLCGARNVFADLGPLSASVSAEAVVAADPQAILAGVQSGSPHDVFARWRRWSDVQAVHMDNLFTLPDDLINRPGPRILQGAGRLCRDVAKARRRIDAAAAPPLPTGRH